MAEKPIVQLPYRALALIGAGLLIAGCAQKTPGQGNALNSRLDQDTLGATIAPGSVQDFSENIGNRVWFEVDSAELSSRARATLDAQVTWLSRYPQYALTIEGHADERGTREYNIALGSRRAIAVRNYLVARGFERGRIRTLSYGKERPVALCNDISCWSQNRRAVSVLKGVGS